MILTSKDRSPETKRYEAEILRSLLDFPGGISAKGIRGGLGRMSLSLELIDALLGRLEFYGLIAWFYEVDHAMSGSDYETFYYLTVDGWLKAAALERPRSSKERMQACGA